MLVELNDYERYVIRDALSNRTLPNYDLINKLEQKEPTNANPTLKRCPACGGEAVEYPAHYICINPGCDVTSIDNSGKAHTRVREDSPEGHKGSPKQGT